MDIKTMRAQTGLSQKKFAELFDIPLSTLKDWEQGRRVPPTYVPRMMDMILQYQNMYINVEHLDTFEARKKYVERTLAILYTATNGPNQTFMKVLEQYIEGAITLDELERRVDQLEFLEG